ncbi:DUF4238 domain-containing protein [Delftia deserti]|uniref:DUF4238 domain-containing protein n=1 Tax=Delftia deserti TaxID=1651218 RepID=A0ABW5ETX3_9BURK
MAQRKNHHFVPQFYFRRFSLDERSICVLTRETGQTIRCASIKAQASRDRFYGSDEVEKFLGKVEGESSLALRVLSGLQDPTDLPDEHLGVLLPWLALQRTRTETARQTSKPMNDMILRLFLEAEIGNDEYLTQEQKAERFNQLEEVSSDAVQSQIMEMDLAIGASGRLSDLEPLLLENRTNRPFIFSDSPVVLHNACYESVKWRGVLGFESPGLLLSYPLSPKLSLLLVDQACYRIKGAPKGRVHIRDLNDIRALNKLQIHSSSSCTYFHDFEFASYVKNLWEQEREVMKAHGASVNEAPGFDSVSGESLGDIVHSFQPLLPIKLRLSFLQSLVGGDEEYRFVPRSSRAWPDLTERRQP